MWCHYLCAVLAGDSVSLGVTAAKKKNKNPLDQNTVLQLITVKSVSKLLYENHNIKCHICQRYGGAMLSCELPHEKTKVHISCAQITDGYSLGFTLQETADNKHTACVELDSGRIVPIIMFHNVVLEIGSKKYPLKQLGKKMNGTNTLKPLLQMHIENITKGQQASSHFGPLALSNQLALMRSQNEQEAAKEIKPDEKKCTECSSILSPIWWEGSELNKPDGVCCNVCYHKHHQLEENGYHLDEDVLLEDMINSPLDPSQYGLISTDDVLSSVYPTEQLSVQ